MIYDKPITIQRQDEDTEEWSDLWKLHADVNKSTGNEYAGSGSQRSVQTLKFRVRFFPELKHIARNTQLYRIVYDGDTFDIEDYDDYMQEHRDIKLEAVSYG